MGELEFGRLLERLFRRKELERELDEERTAWGSNRWWMRQGGWMRAEKGEEGRDFLLWPVYLPVCVSCLLINQLRSSLSLSMD